MKTTYTYDHFYLYGEITEILQKYAQEHPELCRLNSLAKTLEGRDIWQMDITNTKTGSYEDKPAYCIDANIHAGEVTGSMVAMHFLDTIFSNLDDEEVQKALDRYTFYVIPRITPDAGECYLTTPELVRSSTKLYPYETLMPGLQPKDMDGDGLILKMRIKSPYGVWKISDRDPRLMTKRKPDDVDGDFYNVYSEGYIEDFDGHTIETAPGRWGNDYNRNFPLSWTPEYSQRGAGEYPLANIETRAIAEFMTSHKNICSVINLHTMTGVYLYPPGSKHVKDAPAEDIRRYKEIGKMATEETTYPAISIIEDYMPRGSKPLTGSFDDFEYSLLGLHSYAIECWDLNPRAGIPLVFPQKSDSEMTDEEKEEQHYKYIKWIDEHNDGEGFKPWTKFQHPQLGEVEIGGIDYKHIVQNPPVKYLPQEVEKHTRFFWRAVKTLPLIRFVDAKAEKIDGDVYKVQVALANKGYLPTYITGEAKSNKLTRDITVTLQGEGIELVQGKQTETIGQLGGFSTLGASMSTLGPATGNGEPCEKIISWVVKAKPGTVLTFTGGNAKVGKTSTTLTL